MNIERDNWINKRKFSPMPQTVVVLGKNIGIGSNAEDIAKSKYKLSEQSILIVKALAELGKASLKSPDNKIENIVFSAGPTAGPNNPSEAEAMHAYLDNIAPEVSKNIKIFEEKTSYDTYTGAKDVREILDKNKLSNIGLLGISYHIRNAKTIFKRNGVKPSKAFKAEDILKSIDPYFRDKINPRLQHSATFMLERLKEAVSTILLQTIDRKGKLRNWITSRTRVNAKNKQAKLTPTFA